MTTRANWFIDVAIPDVDLDEPPQPLVEEIAEKIDLRNPDDLTNLLYQLQCAEVLMANDGLTCAIRDDPESNCSSCPVAVPLSGTNPLGALCANAKHQERLITSLVVHRHAPDGRAA